MCDSFEVYLVYSVRPQTPKNYKEFLDSRIHLIEIATFGNLKNIKNDIKVIKELRQIEDEVNPDIIHLHSSIAGGLGRIAFHGKKNTVLYTPHGYSFILMGKGKKSIVYRMLESFLGKHTNAITLTCCESEDEIARTICKRTSYIETGVNLSDISASLDGIVPVKNEKFTVFTLGRACIQKQPQLFNKIAELVPEARFVWIGNGELVKFLTAHNVSFCHYIIYVFPGLCS
jgi:glycosyltransferase involved in cell wall biosynthesis